MDYKELAEKAEQRVKKLDEAHKKTLAELEASQ